MPEIQILPANSPKKPFEIMTAWHARPGPVPWVQVGNLFLSCFETGETSWQPIVEQLAKDKIKRKRFTICTGRHGSYVVKANSQTGQFTGIKDNTHLIEDLKGVAGVRKKVPGSLDMMVIDVTGRDFNSIPRLQSFLMQNISAGRTIILAWCYSIFAMNGVPSDISDDELRQKVPGLKEVTIKQLVDKHWAFAK